MKGHNPQLGWIAVITFPSSGEFIVGVVIDIRTNSDGRTNAVLLSEHAGRAMVYTRRKGNMWVRRGRQIRTNWESVTLISPEDSRLLSDELKEAVGESLEKWSVGGRRRSRICYEEQF